MATKKGAAAAEAPAFEKKQLAACQDFREQADLVNALLEDGKLPRTPSRVNSNACRCTGGKRLDTAAALTSMPASARSISGIVMLSSPLQRLHTLNPRYPSARQ